MIRDQAAFAALVSGGEAGTLRAAWRDTAAVLGRQAHVAARTALPQLRRAGAGERFARDHEAAWNRLFDGLRDWQRQGVVDVDLPFGPNSLTTGWNSPDAPRVLGAALSARVTLIVSQVPAWLEPFARADLLVDMNERGATRRIAALAGRGAALLAMFDNHYAGSAAVHAPLLGRVVAVPSGLLELVAAGAYRLDFPAKRDGRIVVAQSLDVRGRTPVELATWYNERLAEQVRERPAEWLGLSALRGRTKDRSVVRPPVR